jgi:hypothetical protein
MNVYCINPISAGNGFKVHIADQADGLRVVGIFLTEIDAEAWIAADRQLMRTRCGAARNSASPA